MRCLRLYGDELEARVEEALRDDDPVRGLRKLLIASADRLADPSTPPGCLRCNATLELSDTELFDDLREANDRYRHHMGRIVDRAVEIGRLSEAKAADLASYVTVIVNGMVSCPERGRLGMNSMPSLIERSVNSAQHDGGRGHRLSTIGASAPRSWLSPRDRDSGDDPRHVFSVFLNSQV